MRKVPGFRLLAIARDWFDQGTVERVFEPLVADYQHEFAEAEGRQRWKVRVQVHIAFARSFAVTLLTHLAAPLPVGMMGRTWLALEGFAAIGTLLLAYAYAVTGVSVDGHILLSLAGVAAPLALLPTAVVLCTPGERRRPARFAALRAALLVTALLVPAAGWHIPASNQRWREASAAAVGNHGPVPRGPRELTLPELWPQEATAAVRFERHNRLSILVMPTVLCVLGLSIAGAVKRALVWVVAAAAWTLSGGVWLLLVQALEGGSMWFGPWIPAALALTMAATLSARGAGAEGDAGTLG